MKSNFLRFIKNILLFGILTLLCDRGIALIEAKLYATQDTKINYVERESVADIIIMGSSRASHHYIPQILMDSLHMTCVNL